MLLMTFGRLGPPWSGWFSDDRPLQSRAVGVGHFDALIAIPIRSSSSPRCPPRHVWLECSNCAVGVGQNEDPLSQVGRSDIARAKHLPLRIEPEIGQVPEYAVDSSNKERADVL